LERLAGVYDTNHRYDVLILHVSMRRKSVPFFSDHAHKSGP